MNVFLVFLGGGIGSVLRYILNFYIRDKTTVEFPYGVLAINIIGSFAIGILAGWVKRDLPYGLTDDQVISFMMVGVCGGFTTFSAFSLDAVAMLSAGRTAAALTYIILSVICAMLATFAGVTLVK